MNNPSRSSFVPTAMIILLAVYSAFLTIGLFRVQAKVEQQALDQRSELATTRAKVDQVVAYLDTFHDGDDDQSKADLKRVKVVIGEHEQKLHLLQDTMSKLFAIEE